MFIKKFFPQVIFKVFNVSYGLNLSSLTIFLVSGLHLTNPEYKKIYHFTVFLVKP